MKNKHGEYLVGAVFDIPGDANSVVDAMIKHRFSDVSGLHPAQGWRAG